MTRLVLLLALVLGAALMGCGAHFDLPAQEGFVQLEHDAAHYDYRATTADGVVIGVRELDAEGGDLAFWTEAVRNRLRMNGGYALLEERETQSADGTPGMQLRFGRDQAGTPYRYWVTLFAKGSGLVMVEAGGQSEVFDAREHEVHQAIEALRL